MSDEYINDFINSDPDNESNPDAWLMVFADLLSLILAFFVLLFSLSTLNKIKFSKISYSLAQKLNPDETREYIPPAAMESTDREVVDEEKNLDYLMSIINDKFRNYKQLSKAYVVERLDDRVVLSLVGNRVFEQHTTNLTQEGINTISLMGDVLQSIKNQVHIYGNVNSETNLAQNFTSKWELSLSRAIIASQLLRKRGYKYNVVSFGRADANYNELAFSTKAQRNFISDRIDIVILDHGAEYRLTK